VGKWWKLRVCVLVGERRAGRETGRRRERRMERERAVGWRGKSVVTRRKGSGQNKHRQPRTMIITRQAEAAEAEASPRHNWRV